MFESDFEEEVEDYYQDDDQVFHKHPKYMDYKKRFESFHHWPKKSKKCPLKLSKAGFFYTGIGEQVICFSCGKLWITSKKIKYRNHCDYWMEHALLDNHKKCDYVISVKGTDFITDAWTDDRHSWFLKYEARKRREQRKAEREQKKRMEEQAKMEMENIQNENEMEETAAAQDI